MKETNPLKPGRKALEIDSIDRQIILATQNGLPLVERPYDEIARQTGIASKEIQSRLKSMLERGIIRRIGAVPHHYRLGITANGMSVWDVPDDLVDEAGALVGALDYVSHCYRRPRHLPSWPYNLFAMVHGTSREIVEQKIAAIATLLDKRVTSHTILYSTKVLKKTGLRLHKSEQPVQPPQNSPPQNSGEKNV